MFSPHTVLTTLMCDSQNIGPRLGNNGQQPDQLTRSVRDHRRKASFTPCFRKAAVNNARHIIYIDIPAANNSHDLLFV